MQPAFDARAAALSSLPGLKTPEPRPQTGRKAALAGRRGCLSFLSVAGGHGHGPSGVSSLRPACCGTACCGGAPHEAVGRRRERSREEEEARAGEKDAGRQVLGGLPSLPVAAARLGRAGRRVLSRSERARCSANKRSPERRALQFCVAPAGLEEAGVTRTCSAHGQNTGAFPVARP